MNYPMPAPVVAPAAQPPQPFGGQSHGNHVPVSQRPTQRQLLPGVGSSQAPTSDPSTWVAQQQQQQQYLQHEQQRQHQRLPQQQPQSNPQQVVANIRESESLSDSLEGVSRGVKQIVTQQCRFQRVPRLSAFRNLQSVLLADCRISEIEPGAFYGLSCLQTIDLHGNNLSSIPDDCIMNCGNLKNLNLRNNKLTKAPRLAGCTEVADIDLSMNCMTTLNDFMDDIGVDVWGTVNKLSLRGNELTDWTDVKNLAGFENLETLDISSNPFCTDLSIDLRLFCLWLCPMLSLIDGRQTTIDDINKASSLFVDQSGGTSNEALLIDAGSADSAELHKYLIERIPVTVVDKTREQQQQQQQRIKQQQQQQEPDTAVNKDLPAVKQKVKEMSQVIRVLHRAHMNRRLQAATSIKQWYRSCKVQKKLPPNVLQRLKQMSIWEWPKRSRDRDPRTSTIAVSTRPWVENVISHSRRPDVREHCKLLLPFTVVGASSPQPCRRRNLASKAATTIQKNCRRYLVHTRFEEVKLCLYSALTIQAVWKGHSTRSMLKKNRTQVLIKRDVLRLEETVESLKTKNEMLQNALRVLWNESRGMQAVVKKMRLSAAIKIQSVYRGHRGRLRFTHIKARYEEHCRRYFTPINRLQKCLRAFAVRKNLGEQFREHQRRAAEERSKREREERIERERLADRQEIKDLKNQLQQLFEIVKGLQTGGNVNISAAQPASDRKEVVTKQPSPEKRQPSPKQSSTPVSYNKYNFECEEDYQEEEFEDGSLSEVGDEPVGVYPVRSTGLRFIGASAAAGGTRYPATSNSVVGVADDILPLSHRVPYSSYSSTVHQNPSIDEPEPEAEAEAEGDFVDHLPEAAPPSYSNPSHTRNSADFRFNDLINPPKTDISDIL